MQHKSFKPSKSKGQNFLIDENIPAKIVRLTGFDKTCGVLEVGPGFGALTSKLAQSAGHVVAVELDTRLIPELRKVTDSYENVTIIQGDILKQNLPSLVEETLPALSRHVCANLPYNITTPAITCFIEAHVFETITVMVQKEVAMRICAKPGTPDYGAFTVFINYHTQPGRLFDIPPECFNPRPKVTSTVVRLITRPEPLTDRDYERKLFRIVKAAFSQRRKTLVNALHAVFHDTHSKQDIIDTIEKAGFSANIRGETLSPEDFIRLCNLL